MTERDSLSIKAKGKYLPKYVINITTYNLSKFLQVWSLLKLSNGSMGIHYSIHSTFVVLSIFQMKRFYSSPKIKSISVGGYVVKRKNTHFRKNENSSCSNIIQMAICGLG